MKHNFFKFLLAGMVLLGTSINLWANCGTYGCYFCYSVDNGTAQCGDVSTDTYALGKISNNVKITSVYLKVYDDGSGSQYLDGCQFGYKIDNGTDQYIGKNVSFSKTGKNGNNYELQAPSFNQVIINATDPSGNHTMKFWWEGINKNDSYRTYLNNDGSNYTMTYTIAPPAVTDFAVSATNGALSGSGTEGNPYLVKYGTTLTLSASSEKAHTDGNSHRNYSFASGSYSTTATYTTGNLTTSGTITVKACCINTSDSNLKGAESSTVVYYTVVYTDLKIADAGCTVDPASYLSSTQVAKGSSVSITQGTPATGYEFDSYSCTNGSVTDNAFKPTANNAKVTVNWKETLHTVSVVCKDEHNTQIGNSFDVTGVGIATSKDVTAPTIAGYTFSTWVLTEGVTSSSTLTNKTISINATADGKIITAIYTKDASFSLQVAKGTHVTTVSGDQATIELGHSYAISATGFDNGYEFNNWTASPSENASFVNANAASTNVTVNNGSVIVTANAKATTYTINYVLPEAVTTTNPTSYTIESAEITLTNPTNRTGYDFAGWTCDDNPITQIAHGSTGNKTITATWTAQTYTITYKDQNNATFTGSWPTPDAHPTTHTYDTETQLVSPTRVGYTFAGWFGNKECTGEAMTSIPATAYTANFTLYAKWTPKTYTISFDQNGGEGGQVDDVTATFDAAMPALSSFTAPVKNGHKFLGYYCEDTKYYNADGSSARSWNVDDNVTLSAKWDQIHVYIEGRFKVRTTLDGNTWKYTGAKDGDYVSEGNSTNIEIPFIEAENKYRLNTYLYVNEAASKIGDESYVLFISTWTQSDGFTKYKANVDEGYNFWFNKDNMSSELTTSGGKNFWFSETTNFGGPIILTYDPVANTLSYTAEPEQKYTVTFIAGGHGHLNEEGPRSVGVRSGYNITATADKGYHFVRFDKTGDVTVNATNNTAKITVTGKGTVTATFAADTRVYFTKPNSWTGSELYAYFDTYWSENKTSGDTYEGAGSKGKADGKAMEHVKDNVYAVSYSGNEAHSEIAFVNAHQDDYQAFDQTSVTYRNDFHHCNTKNWFDTENKKTGDYNKHDGKQTAYYNDGEWKSYQDMPVEFYMRNSVKWDKVCYDQRFKPTSDPNVFEMIWTVTNLTGFNFKVWQTCDCWYGKQNTTINTDGQSINLECNTDEGYNIAFTPWKVGSYEFKLDISTMNLKVNFLDDIVVEDFPQEISVLNSRQYKITPNVRFFNNTKPQDITIEVAHTDGTSDLATYTQSGTNLIVLGDASKTGQETVNVYYKKNSEIIQTRTLIVNVAQPITIQANMSNVAATETHWTNTNLVHVHFWGTDADKSQDAQMTYNETEKVYSVTVPKILGSNGQFNFIIWYGESLSMLGSDNAKWRQTANLATTGNTCYTMGAYTADNANRTATPGTVGTLCLPDVYQVEVYMKNGRTYTSNSVTANDEDKTMSFFAPKDNDNTYSGGQVYLLNNGTIVSTITGFSQADVYTATLNIPATGNASLSDITAYNGDYYVIAGVSGSELNDDTKMHKFTPRANTAEDYSYYWTKYTGNCTDKNVIAKVANKYNSNLSLTIGADALTQADGKVEAGNVRFSYEPTTNAFKRAILGASNSNDFLNVYGNNVYADEGATQPLTEDQSLDLSKFADNSDWVYEKVVYVKVLDAESESKVTLKSVFNGQTSHLLGYEIDSETGEEKKDQPKQLTVLGKGSTTSASAYAIRISYDFKKNRLISSWEPTGGIYESDMSINSDVLFIRTEDGNVQQVQVGIKDGGTESYKISSLQHVMFVMEIDGSTDQTSYSQYWISLPFDCQISDIFGVEGYITLDENRIAQKGTWGIMRYRGDLRAQKGWFKETDGFWEWMYENETMYAGEGYVLFFERSSIKSWPTIKDKGGETKALKRLYFPSAQAGFVMSNTVDAEHSQFECKSMRCTIKTPEDREAYDSNWRVIGPKSYNNITAQTIQTDSPYGTQTQFPHFLYTYNVKAESGHKYVAHNGAEYNYQSFHAYMVQYEGTITWVPYTQTTPPATVAARYVEDSNFKGGTLTIELMQNNEQLDRAFVKLDEKGTVGYDFSQDLTKITENCAQIASISEDVLYAGNTLPLDIEMVPLNVKVVANGTYDIALAQSLEGLEVRLYDAFEQTTTVLDMMSATVTLDKGEYKDRFFLQFVQKSPLTPTNFNGTIEQFNLPTDKTQKLFINDNIYLINAGRIYNASGTQVK